MSAACAASPVPVASGQATGAAGRGRRWAIWAASAWFALVSVPVSVLIAVLVVALTGVASPWAATAQARPAADDLPTITWAELPVQARDTYRLIRAGGPFPHARDGGVFFNRERLLPQRPRGFYRAYTVPTPGARTRGARRIVCGGQQPTAPEVCFYTADHYASFQRIVGTP